MYTELCDRDERDENSEINSKYILERDYQRWYTEACLVMKQLLPDRLEEFEQFYKGDGRRKEIDISTYNIKDWLQGLQPSTNRATGVPLFNSLTIVCLRLNNQIRILASVAVKFESKLTDIQQLVRADLFDSELDTAKELLKHCFLRPAGVVAGVVLEKHLAQVADSNNCKMRKKKPAINDFNQLLKKNDVLDVPKWRQIQRFADIRNLCGHGTEREPTQEEVEELISGVDKITKTLF